MLARSPSTRRALLTLYAAALLTSLVARANTSGSSRENSASGGQTVYQKVEPMVFKVKSAINADSPKASYGTGFAVGAKGLLITNYHVIADAVLQPQRHKIFVVIGGESVPAAVIGLDVLRDLALIRVEREFTTWLKFASVSGPRQGEPIYSIGEPEDLNMAIVIGTYNGELRYGDEYAMIHMSSPINSGMSGGPTVNSRAEIVGVNVAKNAYSDSLSFAVPARFAQALLTRAQDRPPPTIADLQKEMGEQLHSAQEALTHDFLKVANNKQAFGAWSVLQPSPVLKCWSQKEEDSDAGKYDSIRQSCQLPHASYIDESLHSGTYTIELDAIDGRRLKPLPFYTLLNSRFDGGARLDGFAFFGDSGPTLLTRQFCFSKIVANPDGMTFKVAYCSRGYVKFPDLRDASISIASLAPPPHGLLMQLDLRGFSAANIKKIISATLNSIRIGK